MMSAGQYDIALRALEKKIDRANESPETPLDPEVLYQYGVALTAIRRPSLALWPLKEAMKSDEWRARAAMLLAQNAITAQNHAAAIEYSSEVLLDDPDDQSALYMRAYAKALSRRDYEGCLADAERLLELDGESLAGYTLRALALLGLERLDEVAEMIEASEDRLLELDVGVGGDWLAAAWCGIRAKFAHEKGEFELAIERYEECLVLYPAATGIVVDAVALYDERGDYGRSLEIVRAAHEEAPGETFLIPLVLRLRAAGRGDEGEQLLRDATDAPNPYRAAQAWSDLAGYMLDESDPDMDEVIAAYERALEILPSPDPTMQTAYVEALIRASRLDDAAAAASKLPVEAHRRLTLGRIALERHEYAEALRELEAGVQLWPDNAVARYYAAIAAEGLSDFERAVEEYRASIRADTDATDARVRLARIHLAEGNPDGALQIIRWGIDGPSSDLPYVLVELEAMARRRGGVMQVMKLRLPSPQEAPDTWGRALAAVSDGVRSQYGSEEAAKAARSISELGFDMGHPSLAPALRGFVRDLVALGRADEALELTRDATERFPNAAALHAILGTALLGSGADLEAAREAFERSLELDVNRIEALRGLATVAERKGDLARAREFLDRAIAAGPDADSLEQRAELLELLERPTEAERDLEHALRLAPTRSAPALRLATLREARGGAELDAIRSLILRAARFGAGEEAHELLEALEARREGETAGGATQPT